MASSICGTIDVMEPGDAVALVDAAPPGLRAAFVQQDDDGLDTLRAQLLRVTVRRLHLVGEVQPGHARRRDDARRVLERHADEADLDALHLVDGVRRQQRLAGRRDEGVRREVLEVGALEGQVRVRAAAPGGSRRVAAGTSVVRAVPERTGEASLPGQVR